MGKQNVVYTYNGILLHHKEEWNPDTCYHMNEPWRQYAKWSEPDTNGQIVFYSTYMKHPKQANSYR